jgi:large subunit ribosomal protein L30
MAGNIPLTDEIVAEHTDYKNISEFATAIVAGDAQVKDIPNLKRVFRLHPPRGTKGWGGLKRSFVVGGALGSRGEEIGALVERMI